MQDEWTQEEFYKQREHLKAQGIKVLLIDTILKPLEGIETIIYNPPLMQKEPKGSVFVLYCDTGKVTYERLKSYRKKFPDYTIISLRGGRGYWRSHFKPLDTKKLGESIKECKLP